MEVDQKLIHRESEISNEINKPSLKNKKVKISALILMVFLAIGLV